MELIKGNLEQHEATIERGLKTFVEVGRALQAIRDERLYREQYDRFEDYCQERWGWSRQRAYQFIDAAETTGRLTTIVDTHPATESQARPLTQLPPEEQADAWEEVVTEAEETGEKITARKVQQVVAKRVSGKIPDMKKTVTISVDDGAAAAHKIAGLATKLFCVELSQHLLEIHR